MTHSIRLSTPATNVVPDLAAAAPSDAVPRGRLADPLSLAHPGAGPARVAEPRHIGADRAVVDRASVDTLLAMGGDPLMMLLGAQVSLREAGFERQGARVEDASLDATEAADRQAEAVRAAEKAAKRGRGVLGGSKRLGRFLKGAAIAAAAAAAGAVTGGVGTALVIAGAVLVAAAGPTARGLQAAGIIDAQGAARLRIGLEVTGSLLMVAGGGVGGVASAGAGAANTATTVARVSVEVSRWVQAGAQIHKAALDAAGAVYSYQSAQASIDADERGAAVEAAHGEMSDGLATLRHTVSQNERVLGRLREMLVLQDEARMAIAQSIA